MKAKFDAQKSIPDYLNFSRSTPIIGTWVCVALSGLSPLSLVSLLSGLSLALTICAFSILMKDDHDYGINDGGSDYLDKELSKKIFLEFLDEPQVG